MIKRILFSMIVMTVFMAMSSDKPAYQIFNDKGKKTDYDDILKEAKKADIVFFGELHDNSIGHWLELQLAKDLYAEISDKLVLGAEMFETDNQLLLNEYLSGKIAVKNFEEEAKLWKNYKTDYKGLVDFAKAKNLNFIGTNIPRRYAALVSKKGFEVLDSLSPEAKKLIAPTPIKYDPELGCYKGMMEMMKGHGGPVSPNFPKAQAAKDATMAHFILQNWKKGQTFLHFNGSYHSDDHQGIVWYLKQQNPDLKILTITTIEKDTISSITNEEQKKADYILVIPSDMIKTQ